MKRLYDTAWDQAKPTRGTKRIAHELEEWQRKGRSQFEFDLKRPGVLEPHENTPMAVPEVNAANTYGSPQVYDIFQAAQRSPKQALEKIAAAQRREDVPEMPFTLQPTHATYGEGFRKITELSTNELAQELERQGNWLTHAIMRHGEVPTEPLIRMTGMDHLPGSVLEKLQIGETVELTDKGFLAATADIDVAEMVAGITASGKPARWELHADGARALHTNGIDPDNHLIDEWIFPKGTRFTLKRTGIDTYEAHVID